MSFKKQTKLYFAEKNEIFQIIRERYILELNKFNLKYLDGTPYEIYSGLQEYTNLIDVKTYIDNYIAFKPYKLLQKNAMKIFNIQN